MASALKLIVVDNGGGSIKAGIAGEADPVSCFNNAAARIKRQQRLLVGEEIDTKIRDHSQLHYIRPVDRGYVTDFNTQSVIWERILSKDHLGQSVGRDIKAEDAALLYTASPFSPISIQRGLDELVFETMGFEACHRSTASEWLSISFRGRTAPKTIDTPAPSVSEKGTRRNASGKRPVYDIRNEGPAGAGARSMHIASRRPWDSSPSESWWPAIAPAVPRLHDTGVPFPHTGTGIIVDLGFSFTTVTPVHGWQALPEGIRRLPVGGKVLTSVLKETVSYRQFNVMDDPWLVNNLKESLCYVAQDFTTEHAVAMRLSTVPSAPSSLARVMARASGRLEAADAQVCERESCTMGSDLINRVKQRVMKKAGKAPRLTSVTDTDDIAGNHGPMHAQARPLGEYMLHEIGAGPGSASAGGAMVSVCSNPHSHSRIRPDPGSDGVGIGMRREFVLPDYVHVMAGYVKGTAQDPAMALGMKLGDGAMQTDDSGPVAVGAGASFPSAATRSSDGASHPEKQKNGTVDTKHSSEGVKRKEKGKANDKNKKGKGSASSAHMDEVGSENDTDTDTLSDSDMSEDEEDADAAASAGKGDGEYRGGSGVAPQPKREMSARASKAGVSALTSTLRRDGLLAEGDEDEEAGGAREGANRMALGLSKQSALASAHGAGGAPIAEESQVMSINVERIAVPEILFRPTDAGVDSTGLAETVLAAVMACPRYLRSSLLSSIMLVGGGARLPGLEARLERELNTLVRDAAPIALYTPSDPVVACWRGGSIFGCRPDLATVLVTKAQYAEEGSERLAARFALPGGGPASTHLEDSAGLEAIMARLKVASGSVPGGNVKDVGMGAQASWDEDDDIVRMDDPADEDY